MLQDGTNSYLYGAGRIGEEQPAGLTYSSTDVIQSIRQLTSTEAIPLLASAYEPFGSPLLISGTGSTSYGFAGQWQDQSELVHMRARYYSPSTGLFVSKDPWAGDEVDPATLHKWQYAAANPIGYVDPSGQCYGPLEFLRRIPIEKGICESLDQAMFIYAWPGSSRGQRNLAAGYIGGWAFGHSALIVGAGGLALVLGNSAFVWIYGLYQASPYAQQLTRACQDFVNTLRWRTPQSQPTAQRTILWLEEQAQSVQHIVRPSHAWSRLVNMTGNPLQDYRSIQPIIREAITIGERLPILKGPHVEYRALIAGEEIVITVRELTNGIEIVNAYIRTFGTPP